MQLYEQLDKLGRQVMYCDTDSIIYQHDEEEKTHRKIETGPYLGQWKDELEDSEGSNPIVCFRSGGSKNYGYELKRPDKNGEKQTVKIKGISLKSYSTKQALNLTVMSELIQDFQESNTTTVTYKEKDETKEKDEKPIAKKRVVQMEKFTINKKRRTVSTVKTSKSYAVVYDKAELQDDYTSLPFGHQSCKHKCPHHDHGNNSQDTSPTET
jgi:hypothetical protein